MEYLDFELELTAVGRRNYEVAVVNSPAGQAQVTTRFPLDTLELESRLKDLQLALLRSGREGSRRALLPEAQSVQEFGRTLFRALFAEGVRSCYDASQRDAALQNKGLRLKLRVQSPSLAVLPWELLYDPDRGDYVCLSRSTPLVRYPALPLPQQRLTVTPPLRVLGVIASPSDQPPLETERERQRVETAVEDLQARGRLELAWMAGQTWRDLQEQMWGGPWHILHFVGHGGFDRERDEGFVVLADEGRQGQRLYATELGRLLASHFPLRLVVLNSCGGAQGSSQDIFSSVAATLLRRGIPAVLAMQYEITDRAAIELAQTFYRAVAHGMAVDAAVAEARQAVSIAIDGTLEWVTPVLFMRSSDGQIFDLAPAAQEGARTQPTSTAAPPSTTPQRLISPTQPAEQPQRLISETPPESPLRLATETSPLETPTKQISGSSRPGCQLSVVVAFGLVGLSMAAGVLLDRRDWPADLAPAPQATAAPAPAGPSVSPAASPTQPGGVVDRPTPSVVPTGGPAAGQLEIGPVGSLPRSEQVAGHADDVWGLRFSADGSWRVSTSQESPWAIGWNVSSGLPATRYQGHGQGVVAAAWGPSQWPELVATGAFDGSVHVWRAATGERILTLPRPGEPRLARIWGLAWSRDGVYLAAASEDGQCQIWSLDSGPLPTVSLPARQITNRPNAVYALDWRPTTELGPLLAAGLEQEPRVLVWNASNGQVVTPVSGHSGPVQAVAWSPNGQLLASSAQDGTVRLWEAASGSAASKEIGSFQSGAWLRALAWSPDGQWLAAGSRNVVALWRLRGAEAVLAQPLTARVSEIYGLAWARTGQGDLLAIAGKDRLIELVRVTR